MYKPTRKSFTHLDEDFFIGPSLQSMPGPGGDATGSANDPSGIGAGTPTGGGTGGGHPGGPTGNPNGGVAGGSGAPGGGDNNNYSTGVGSGGNTGEGGGNDTGDLYDALAAAAAHAEGLINAGLEQANAIIEGAIGRANDIIAAGQKRAEELIAEGMDKAAAAVIEASERAASAVLEGHRIADRRVRAFWREAKKDLQPIIRQGRYARDEMAAMLGIRNSRGKIVAWDADTLEETPGFKFQYEWGKRAVENSATGRVLSGQSARELTEFGQGLAATRFDQHYAQLAELANMGAVSAGIKGQLATQTGGQLGDQAITTGTNLGNIHMGTGNQLSGIYMQGYGDMARNQMSASLGQAQNVMSGGISMASNTMSGAMAAAGIHTELASQQVNLSLAQMQHEQAMAQIAADRSAARSNSRYSLFGTIFGGFAKGFLSDERLKDNIIKISKGKDLWMYRWDWKEDIPEEYKKYPTTGFIAQEVRDKWPDLVDEDERGYLRVNVAEVVRRNSNG